MKGNSPVVVAGSLLVAAFGCASQKKAAKAPAGSTGDPYADALRGGPPPGYTPGQGPGGVGPTFDSSLDFRSSGEKVVNEWRPERIEKEVMPQAVQLADCGKVAPGGETVDATLYIMPKSGTVGSVGLASLAPIDVVAAA